jgi:hypothetical protein
VPRDVRVVLGSVRVVLGQILEAACTLSVGSSGKPRGWSTEIWWVVEVVGLALGTSLLDTRSRSRTRRGEPVALWGYQSGVLKLLPQGRSKNSRMTGTNTCCCSGSATKPPCVVFRRIKVSPRATLRSNCRICAPTTSRSPASFTYLL